MFAKAGKPTQFYNYAFTWKHSPIGPAYLESIKKKIDTTQGRGFYIISVDPTSLMVDKDKDDVPENFYENDLSVAKTYFVNANPNIEYLVESYEYSITKSLNELVKPDPLRMADIEVLDNGKMDVTITRDFSPEARKKINAEKMIEFQSRLASLKPSPKRLHYLENTIQFLKKHGEVYLLTTPVAHPAKYLEDKYYPNFDADVRQIAAKNKVAYRNYSLESNSNYICVDEVHLAKKSMDYFSTQLSLDILRRNFNTK